LNVKPDDIRLYKAKGCEACGGSGYRGRTGIHELLIGTTAMKKLIYENAPIASILAQAKKDKMRTLIQDGVYKIIKGDTDYQQLMKVVSG